MRIKMNNHVIKELLFMETQISENKVLLFGMSVIDTTEEDPMPLIGTITCDNEKAAEKCESTIPQQLLEKGYFDFTNCEGFNVKNEVENAFGKVLIGEKCSYQLKL